MHLADCVVWDFRRFLRGGDDAEPGVQSRRGRPRASAGGRDQEARPPRGVAVEPLQHVWRPLGGARVGEGQVVTPPPDRV